MRLIQWIFNFEKNNNNDTCPQASCLIFKHVSCFDYLHVVANKVAHNMQLYWIGMYVWTCILTPYIHVAYVLLHATACHVQPVLGKCTNLQLHVSHATKFQLHATVAKPKISSSVDNTQKKLEPKSIRCVFIGYGENVGVKG